MLAIQINQRQGLMAGILEFLTKQEKINSTGELTQSEFDAFVKSALNKLSRQPVYISERGFLRLNFEILWRD